MTQPQPGGVITAAALAEASRRVQADIRRRMLADAAKTWPLLNPRRLNETWPGWLRVMTQMLRSYHGETAAAASAYYRAERIRTLGEAPDGIVKLADPPSDEWLGRALGYSAPGRIDRFVNLGFTEEQAASKALPQMLGTADFITLDAQRTTILDTADSDPAKARWYRLTDGNPCPWCALLASRGAVYRSDETVAFNESGKFENTSKFGGHNSCGCTAAVSFTGQVTLTGTADLANSIYFGTDDKYLDERGRSIAQLPNHQRLPAFRKAWAEHGPAATTAA